MFLLTLLIVVILASYLLTKRSLRDFQEKPEENQDYAIFLVRRRKFLDQDFLTTLHRTAREVIISFEKLYKGQEGAMVLYAPRRIEKQFPDLELLELEDYSEKIKTTETLAWELVKDNKGRGLSFSLKFLDQIKLSNNDQLYCQIVTQPINPKHKSIHATVFQISLRMVIISPEPEKRLKIAKQIDEHMKSLGTLKRRKRTRPLTQIVKNFRERLLTPKEVTDFSIEGEDLLSLLN